MKPSEVTLYYWQVLYLSVHEKLEKNLQCWQVFYLSGNEILFFFRKIFIFRYHWQVKYLSAIERSNHSPSDFLVFDRCFTCQWPTFYVLSYCLTGVLPVSNNIWYSLTGTLPVSDYFLSIDRWFTCQCHWNIVWQVIYLSMMNFNNHWQVIYLSVIKSHVFRSTDRYFSCQTDRGGTGLSPVCFELKISLWFLFEIQTKCFLNCEQPFSKVWLENSVSIVVYIYVCTCIFV